MKAFKCDICKKYIEGVSDYGIKLTDRQVDIRDGEPYIEGDLCDKCYNELKKRIKGD